MQFFAQHPQLQIDLPSYFNIVAGIPSATYRVPLRGVELNNTINPTAVHKGSTGTMPNCSTKILPLLRIQYTDLHSLCFKSCNVPKSQATTFVSGWSEDLVFGRFQLQTNSSSSRCISKLSLPKSVSMRCPAFTQSVATSSFTSPPCFLVRMNGSCLTFLKLVVLDRMGCIPFMSIFFRLHHVPLLTTTLPMPLLQLRFTPSNSAISCKRTR